MHTCSRGKHKAAFPSATPMSIPATVTPSPTQLLPTQTITPLPTIPTFTPTFDAWTIVTVTPAAKAECPKEDSNIVPTFYVPKFPGCFDSDRCLVSGTEEEILGFLNKGATIQSVMARLRTAIYGDYQEYAYQDVTGDNIPDLMFIDFSTMGRLHIFFCNNGSYKLFSSKIDLQGTAVNQKIVIQDLNLDAIPEIVFLQGYANTCCMIHILEWDGQTFPDLSQYVETSNEEMAIEDIDQNGTKEIVTAHIMSASEFYANPDLSSLSLEIPPLRMLTRIYSWDGKNFVFSSENFKSYQYRFQAVQDGDLQTLQGNYREAIKLYEDAINSNKLDWWSKERFEQNRQAAINFGTPLVLAPDKTEYPRLAAYAYYRIMLLHIVQGHESEAGTVYKTLQQEFDSDPYARPYIAMATTFWNAYQSTHKMYDGCAAAIQYAAEHPNILTPLGSDYHGSQSHIYVPSDVCPFR